MKHKLIASFIIPSLLLTGCALYRTTLKYEFKDEFYTVKQQDARYPIYVHNTGDTVKLYALSESNRILK